MDKDKSEINSSNDEKIERRLIPVEIINRYSDLFRNSDDLWSLTKTGYREDLIESGFMTEESAIYARLLCELRFERGHSEYEKYYHSMGRYEFPLEYAHENWLDVKRNVSDCMTIEDVCLIAFPVIGWVFCDMREILSRKIIERVLDEDMYPMLSVYPDGVFDDADYRRKENLQIKGRISLHEFRYACKADSFKTIKPISKINKTCHGEERETANFLAMWENLLYTPSHIVPEPPSPELLPETLPAKPKLKRNVAAQKMQILKEIEEQGLDPMNIKLKEFKAKFLLDYPEMTDRMFMKAWWELSDESKVRSDRYTLKK